jgi:hypothetical protein
MKTKKKIDQPFYEALNKLRKRGDSNLQPCWELYKTKSGKCAVLDKNNPSWRAVVLGTSGFQEAGEFLTMNGIHFMREDATQ